MFTSKGRAEARLSLESLEDRRLMAVAAGGIQHGINSGGDIEIKGTNYHDSVVVSDDWSQGRLRFKVEMRTTGNPFPTYGVTNKYYEAWEVQGLDVYFYGNGGDDTFTNTSSLWTYARGGVGNDKLQGSGGNDYLYGDAGNDKLYGGSGSDYIFGGYGNDEIHGQRGNDTIFGDEQYDPVNGGQDIIYGGFGPSGGLSNEYWDQYYAESGYDVIRGGAGDDELFGGLGGDTIYGEAGSDWIEGQGGGDFLYGGAGVDALVGGLGSDRFHDQPNSYGFNDEWYQFRTARRFAPYAGPQDFNAALDSYYSRNFYS